MISTYVLLIPILASFLISMFLTPLWIKRARLIGLIWTDMNKYDRPKIPGSGGIVTVTAFVIGVLFYIAYRTFYVNSSLYVIETFALISVVLFLLGIGFVDDLFGWQKGGLRRRHRMILIAIASIPLMVINAGKSSTWLPFVGNVELGLLYALVIIPIGIVGATTTFNFLAGFNGLEASQGALILTALSIVAFFTGNPWLSIISLCMVASLLGFLMYNRYPSAVFPGDSLTYAVGGLIACISILGNFERVAVFFFIPYIIETVLKSRGKLTKQSFGKTSKDGTLDLQYKKIYGLTHAAIFIMKKFNIKPTEKRVVYFILLFHLTIIILGFIIFREGIFG